MKIETKQELQYVMQFHNIPYVRIVDDGHDMGKVTKDMKYEPGSWRYNKGYENLAFEQACKQLAKDYEELKTWREISQKVFITRLLSGTWKGEKKPVTGYCWTSDAEKCHLKMSKDVNGCLLLQGRVHDLNNFRSYANDHMRYVQDRYYLESADVNHNVELFDRYGLRNADDDGYEWWRVGIVD